MELHEFMKLDEITLEVHADGAVDQGLKHPGICKMRSEDKVN